MAPPLAVSYLRLIFAEQADRKIIQNSRLPGRGYEEGKRALRR